MIRYSLLIIVLASVGCWPLPPPREGHPLNDRVVLESSIDSNSHYTDQDVTLTIRPHYRNRTGNNKSYSNLPVQFTLATLNISIANPNGRIAHYSKSDISGQQTEIVVTIPKRYFTIPGPYAISAMAYGGTDICYHWGGNTVALNILDRQQVAEPDRKHVAQGGE